MLVIEQGVLLMGFVNDKEKPEKTEPKKEDEGGDGFGLLGIAVITFSL
jgi:hypothetical protein